MRRVVDVVVSASALVILVPVMLAIAIGIVIDSPGNPFYRALRAGRNGRTFRMWKFRTMSTPGNVWQTGPGITSRRDVRITRLGRILRRSKLDELPQFVNVLLGHMTLVGPRPEAPEFVAYYDTRQRRVLDVKPGVTGVAQVAAAEESDSIPEGVKPDQYYVTHLMAPKLELDLDYLETRTARSDAKIVLATAAMVARVIYRMVRSRAEFPAHAPIIGVAAEAAPEETLDRRSV